MVNVTAVTLPRLEVLKISLLKGTQQVTILRTKQSTYKPINHNTHFIIATNTYNMKNCQKGSFPTLNDGKQRFDPRPKLFRFISLATGS